MDILFESQRLNICLAKEQDIDTIMDLEQHKENRRFVWQGTYEQHVDEINDDSYLLLTIREKSDDSIVGFILAVVDLKSDVFELRRIAISKKGIGYGRETLQSMMKYSFDSLHTNRFWLDVYPDNEVGIKLYESLGMKLDGKLRQSYKRGDFYLDQLVYSILREEYHRKQKH